MLLAAPWLPPLARSALACPGGLRGVSGRSLARRHLEGLEAVSWGRGLGEREGQAWPARNYVTASLLDQVVVMSRLCAQATVQQLWALSVLFHKELNY